MVRAMSAKVSRPHALGATPSLFPVIIPGMFIIELTYRAELEQIDQAMSAHVAFLKEQYAAGVFVASGRKIPRNGGIILATASTRDEIDQIMDKDPFCARGLAEYSVIEFRLSQRARDLQKLIDAEPSR